jgi:hypothetical protein
MADEVLLKNFCAKNPRHRQAANHKLKIGAMLYLEASNDIWSINSDLFYMNLEQEISP